MSSVGHVDQSAALRTLYLARVSIAMRITHEMRERIGKARGFSHTYYAEEDFSSCVTELSVA